MLYFYVGPLVGVQIEFLSCRCSKHLPDDESTSNRRHRGSSKRHYCTGVLTILKYLPCFDALL